jgi:hypothetical protein
VRHNARQGRLAGTSGAGNQAVRGLGVTQSRTCHDNLEPCHKFTLTHQRVNVGWSFQGCGHFSSFQLFHLGQSADLRRTGRESYRYGAHQSMRYNVPLVSRLQRGHHTTEGRNLGFPSCVVHRIIRALGGVTVSDKSIYPLLAGFKSCVHFVTV